jgi:5-methylcytosine-specific restriction enzyme A
MGVQKGAIPQSQTREAEDHNGGFRMTDPRRFSKDVMRQAYARRNGRCKCTAKLTPGNVIYDHIIPYEFSRDSSLSNCEARCKNCDSKKTYEVDIPTIAKIKRIADNHIAVRRVGSRPMPCGRNTGFKKTMRGKVVGRMNLGQMLRQMGLVK